MGVCGFESRWGLLGCRWGGPRPALDRAEAGSRSSSDSGRPCRRTRGLQMRGRPRVQLWGDRVGAGQAWGRLGCPVAAIAHLGRAPRGRGPALGVCCRLSSSSSGSSGRSRAPWHGGTACASLDSGLQAGYQAPAAGLPAALPEGPSRQALPVRATTETDRTGLPLFSSR